MHCATPTISDTKHTILQATDTLTALGKNVPSSTSEFIAQSKTIQKLHEIIMSIHQVTTQNPSPSVMRVSTHNITPPPTYNPTRTPSTSKDLTVPSNVSLLQPIHQRQTEAYWKLEDYTPDDKDKDIADVITIQASNQHSNATLSLFLRQMLEHPGRTIHHSFFTSPVANTVRGGEGSKVLWVLTWAF